MSKSQNIKQKLIALTENTIYDKNCIDFLSLPDREYVAEKRANLYRFLTDRIQKEQGIVVPYSPTSKVNILHIYLMEKVQEITKAGIPVSVFLRDTALGEVSEELGHLAEPHITLLNRTGKITIVRESECLSLMSEKLVDLHKKYAWRYWKLLPITGQRLESTLLTLLWSSFSNSAAILVGNVERNVFDSLQDLLRREASIGLYGIYLPTIPISDYNNLIVINDDKARIETKLRNELLSGLGGLEYIKMLYRFFVFRKKLDQYTIKKKFMRNEASTQDLITDVSTNLYSYLNEMRVHLRAL